MISISATQGVLRGCCWLVCCPAWVWRGISDPLAFPEIEQLRGDRGGDLSALAGRAWDAVIDLSGTHPEWVRQSGGRLAASIEHYLLLSSTAVYAAFDRRPADESLVLRDDGPEFGARKAGCEREAEHALPGRVYTPRSVYTVGAGDPAGRLDAWFDAIKAGPTLELPGPPELVVQLPSPRTRTAVRGGRGAPRSASLRQ